MNGKALVHRFRTLCSETVPLFGKGSTRKRLARLMEIGREDLTLAKLVEAHWDAVTILSEAGRTPAKNAIYGVWAAAMPGVQLSMSEADDGWIINGTKPFCSGATLVDRALITVPAPHERLVDLNLRENAQTVTFDGSFWKTAAFAESKTANATFAQAKASEDALIGPEGWYLARPGFWHGALGPAACWAGGAAALVDFAHKQKRADPHTLAHLGALEASVWAMRSFLESAGDEIDAFPHDVALAHSRALTVRHLIEQACTDTLRRFARAYGPYPIAANAEISRRYTELDIFLRQSHAERDLEALGTILRCSPE